MIQYRWEQSLSPGNEQSFYWGSAAADEQGSRNYMGVRSPAIDAMIAAMLRARERRRFRCRRTRARPRADLRMLRRAAVLSAGAMGGALDLDRASRPHIAVRLSAGNLVVSTQAGAAMILGEPQAPTTSRAGPDPVTIDEVFRRHAQRRPDALALDDPRQPRDFHRRRAASPHLRRSRPHRHGHRRAAARMGLPTDAVVGIQLPNIAENFLATLGVLRAGMIAAPLPLLWRRADAVAALARIGAKALITCSHVGAFNHCQFAMRWRPTCFPSATCADLDKISPTAWCRSTICSLRKRSTRRRTREQNGQCRRPRRGHHFRCRRRRHCAGRAQPRRTAGGRSRGAARKPASRRIKYPIGACSILFRRHLPDASAVAPVAAARSSFTTPFDRRRFRSPARERSLPDPDFAGPVAFRLRRTAVRRRPASMLIAAWRSPERLAMSPAWREPEA